MNRKFQVHWTGNKDWQEKNPKGPVMNLQEFTTRKAAEEFVKQNKYIYWSSITSSMPRSNWPKVIVSPSEDLSLTHQPITGILDTYFETGMEGISIIVDPLKQGKTPNPSYDPSKPDSDDNFPFYKDLMDMHFINKNDVMEISGMRYHLVHDRDFALEDDYRMSIYPAGFSKAEIVALIQSKAKVTVWFPKKEKK